MYFCVCIHVVAYMCVDIQKPDEIRDENLIELEVCLYVCVCVHSRNYMYVVDIQEPDEIGDENLIEIEVTICMCVCVFVYCMCKYIQESQVMHNETLIQIEYIIYTYVVCNAR